MVAKLLEGRSLLVLFTSTVPKPKAHRAQSEHSVTFIGRVHTETPARNEDKICTVLKCICSTIIFLRENEKYLIKMQKHVKREGSGVFIKR